MSQVINSKLSDETAERLKQLARRLEKSPDETAAILIEESLREQEFVYIEFRNSLTGRQPYMKNSNLTVWQIIRIARDYGMDEKKVATHFQRPNEWVKAAFRYNEAYPEEVDTAIINTQATNYDALKQILPQLEKEIVPQAILEDN